MKTKNIKLGQKVKFWKILKRERQPYKLGEHGPTKKWIEKDCADSNGIVIGVRTLYDSYVEYFEDYIACENVNPKKAILVSFDLKRKPVYVPMDGWF